MAYTCTVQEKRTFPVSIGSHIFYVEQYQLTGIRKFAEQTTTAGMSVFYQSSDELSGKLDGVPFRAVNVCTGEKVSARSSTPKILFEGQVIK